jgi:hypothetical protein
MLLARADLEALLRDRKLDGTLTTVLPARSSGGTDEYATASIGITALDAWLEGGFPRGQISEVVGARSTGRASVLLQMLAAATARREIVALVDVLDMLDVASADAAGVDLTRLLWVRGQAVPHPGLCRELNQRALDRAIKALTLVLQAGNFGLVVFDAAEAPLHSFQSLPFTTWRRLQCIIEGSQTACVLAADAPVARSSGGLTLKLSRAEGNRTEGNKAEGRGIRTDRLFKGFDLDVEVIRARPYRQETVAVRLSTHAL